MKDAHELLAKLRAAGVEPMADERLLEWGRLVEIEVDEHPPRAELHRIRVVADLLEARAKLAEVRASLESDLRQGLPTSAAELLEILDKEHKP